MAIPTFQEITLPLLSLASDGQVRSLSIARKALADHFKLTDAEESELLPSGRQGRFANRVAWAKVYLERAGVLASPGRGQFQITPRGREILVNPPEILDIKYLERYPEFRVFRAKPQESVPTPASGVELATPEEALEAAYQGIRAGLASELLERVKSASPRFFELLVVELLLKMGYGRSGGTGEAIGKSGDEGIDGVIAEDRLGLEMVYLQAKRWEGTVGRPEVQKFVGALHGRRAKKGVFITTGVFSSEAANYVKTIDPRVALIDGPQLAQFMIDHNVGVTPSQTYEVKKIDSDYFEE
ncbi:MAG: restriction endonuclease [Burkholderiaceae bacterium]|jgi:restriction system protein|nr:restriction endonuclease [Burkholderiaceae bacterium]